MRRRKQSPIRTTSVALPKSPVSLAWGDEVPYLLTRKSRLQAAEFLITSAKRLLQHYRGKADLACPLPSHQSRMTHFGPRRLNFTAMHKVNFHLASAEQFHMLVHVLHGSRCFRGCARKWCSFRLRVALVRPCRRRYPKHSLTSLHRRRSERAEGRRGREW